MEDSREAFALTTARSIPGHGACLRRLPRGRPADKAHRVAAGLRAGTVWINRHNVFDAAAPFGGYKKIGYGHEMGRHALELYTQTKNVIVRLG